MAHHESIYALFSRAVRKFSGWCSVVCNRLKFRFFGISFGKSCRPQGKIYLERKDGASITLGNGFTCIGGRGTNRIGRNLASGLYAAPGAEIRIGNNVGISCSCIWSRSSITIGDNTKIGADCIILDHDAHSLNPLSRREWSKDSADIASEPVVIGSDVLVGARSIILKGAVIGEGSIIGAGSVVTGVIPPSQVWAGNPAIFIRSV